MNNILSIRRRLRLSQKAFGAEIDVTQGNVSHYERGQEVPPAVARRVIDAALRRGVNLTFDDVYGVAHPMDGASPPRSKPRPQPASGPGASTGYPTAGQVPQDAPAATAATPQAGATRTAAGECQGVA